MCASRCESLSSPQPEPRRSVDSVVFTTQHVRFEAAHLADEVDHGCEKTVIYPNPTRQRGLWGNAKTQSLADASGWDRHKFASSKRISEGSSYRRGKLRLKSPGVSWCRVGVMVLSDRSGERRILPVQGGAVLAEAAISRSRIGRKCIWKRFLETSAAGDT